jgi:hypothetical protein
LANYQERKAVDTLINDHPDLQPDTILTGERLYAEAIDVILSSAQMQLQIFDQDFRHGNFSSLKKYELLRHFLGANLNSALTIILQDTTFFREKCPRLMELLEIYGHKMRVFETNATVKHAKDCFILADATHYLKRIHIDQARFRYAFDDVTTVEGLSLRFDELLDATQDSVSPTTLGL